MEQEIQRRGIRFSKRTKALMEDETGISTSVDDEDIKRYLDEVLVELKGKRNRELRAYYSCFTTCLYISP